MCLVLAVIDAATGLLPNRSTYPAFPVVAGLLLAASLGLASLAGSAAACSRRPRSAGCSCCWLRTAWGWAMSSWPRPWAWRSAGCRGDGGGGVGAGFLLGGLAGLGGMLALGLSRTSRLPFGPWLVGALLGVLVGGEVAGWFQASSAPGRPGQPLRTMMRPSMPV